MKTISTLIIFYFLVTACSSSYVVSTSGDDTSVDEFNEFAEGKGSEITLRDSIVITTTDVYLSAHSFYWIDYETERKTSIVKSEIREVMFTDM